MGWFLTELEGGGGEIAEGGKREVVDRLDEGVGR